MIHKKIRERREEYELTENQPFFEGKFFSKEHAKHRKENEKKPKSVWLAFGGGVQLEQKKKQRKKCDK